MGGSSCFVLSGCSGSGKSTLLAARVEGIDYFEQQGLPIPDEITRAGRQCRVASKVFMTPPRSAIFVKDGERRHGFEEALAEYESLLPCYEAQGHQVVIVPKAPVAACADFVLRESGADRGGADATA